MAKNKILVVDDNGDMREALKDTLIAKGFEVVTASDGAMGLKCALAEKPEIVVTDVQMPVMDGMKMLAELRKSGDWGKGVPVIILTSFDTNEKIMEGVVKDEPSFYLMKSEINPRMIADMIKEKLGISST